MESASSLERTCDNDPVFEYVRQFCILACMAGFSPGMEYDFRGASRDVMNLLQRWMQEKEESYKDSDEMLRACKEAYRIAEDMMLCAGSMLF